MSKPAAAFEPLALAVLTVSDTRTPENDTSGDLLVHRLEEAGHHLQARQIVKDDIYQLRKVVSEWIADERIQGIITTGGTGFSGRDSTPEALGVLFDKHIEGFGELFRQVKCGGYRLVHHPVPLPGRVGQSHGDLLSAGFQQCLCHGLGPHHSRPAGCPPSALQFCRPDSPVMMTMTEGEGR